VRGCSAWWCAGRRAGLRSARPAGRHRNPDVRSPRAVVPTRYPHTKKRCLLGPLNLRLSSPHRLSTRPPFAMRALRRRCLPVLAMTRLQRRRRDGPSNAPEIREGDWAPLPGSLTKPMSVYASVERVIGDRWGVTYDEVARPFPCDEWVRSPTLVAWRGVTVNTSASDLWPWVTQVRAAPYSYDWIDNLGRRSPRMLIGLPDPAVGDHFTRAAGISLGRILSVDAPYQLTGRIAGAVISYVLEQPPGLACTRLLMKIASEAARPLAPLLSVGDLVMARRQLLNWRRLAEAARPLASLPGRAL
jgi:hypothetical protein